MRGTLCGCTAATALLLCVSADARAVDTIINGSAMAMRSYASFPSGGSDSGANATLTQNGYVGTYIYLPTAGAVTLSASATGTASNGVNPDMTISIADYSQSFGVTSGTNNYTYTTPVLPAGTYVVRTQMDNSGTQMIGGAPVNVSPSLNIGNFTVSSNATVKNTNATSDTNALDAANTYINNFRQGTATVSTGFTGGTQVQVSMLRNAFNFGGTVSGVSQGDSKDMISGSSALNTQSGQFQSFINQYFNMIVPSNGGKWASNEPTQNNLTMQLVDEQLAYAKAHNMNVRMHNLIWASNATTGAQQPTFVNNLLSTATGGGAGAAAAKQTLTTDITNRIAYYVNGVSNSTGSGKTFGTGDLRGTDYMQMDVLNEAVNHPAYWNIFPNGTDANGTGSIASLDVIYHQVQQAAGAAGNPNMKLLTNEYNVLQYSPQSVTTGGTEQGSDPYANYYRNEVEAINNGAVKDFNSNSKVVTEIGMEMYSDVSGNNSPVASTMQKALQNLSGEGLPLSMNEFGMGSTANSQTKGPGVLDTTLRMFYGNPLADTFMNWGWWDTNGNTPPEQMIITADGAGNYTLTSLGQMWVNDMNAFTTPTASVSVNADHTVNFSGFYGEYALKANVNGNMMAVATVDFEKGPNNTQVETLWVKGDYNLNGLLDNGDLSAMLNALKNLNAYQASHNMSNEEFLAICDITGGANLTPDNLVNMKDLIGLELLLASGIQIGDGIFGEASLASVPEPASAVLAALSFGLVMLGARRRWR